MKADWVRTNCPMDGTVEVMSSDITLVIGSPGRNRYTFRCPRCQLDIDKLADEKVLGLLLLTAAVVAVPRHAGGDAYGGDAE